MVRGVATLTLTLSLTLQGDEHGCCDSPNGSSWMRCFGRRGCCAVDGRTIHITGSCLKNMRNLVIVCVFFTLNRSSTRRHPAQPVSVLILHPRKISSVITSYDTEIMHRDAFDNAMSCPSTGYDRHNIHTSATEIHWKREYEKNKNNNKNKIIIRKQIKQR